MEPVEQKGLTIILPAYNEALGLERVLAELKAKAGDFVREIIVVDDASTDGTDAVATSAGVRLIRHQRNLGYGASLKTGFLAASTEFVATMDSDGQHRVEDLLRLWAVAERNDMVVGKRSKRLHSPLWRMPGKWLLSFTAQYVARARIPDLNSGLRVFRRQIARRYLHLCPRGFSFSTTMTMVMLSRGYNVEFVPIEVDKRMGKSTVSLATGFETLILLFRIAVLFDPLRVFLPASFAIGTIGVLWGIPYALSGRGISVGSMLAVVASLILFALGLLTDQISQLRLERYE